VVIAAWNEEGAIERAILSAGQQGAEVIVVDGGSTDGTLRRARAAVEALGDQR
jgi:glycosyltransferase involved in cell wall biosynthesis